MRYVEVTTIYVVPVPEDQESGLDAVVNTGVTVMEQFIKDKAKNVLDVRSDWKLMPYEYRPEQPVPTGEDLISFDQAHVPEFTDTPHERDRLESLKVIEADVDQGISFVGDVMGQRPERPPHPWDQGLRITPEGHDLFDAETQALRDQEMICGVVDEVHNVECVGVKGHADQHMWVTRKGGEIEDGR